MKAIVAPGDREGRGGRASRAPEFTTAAVPLQLVGDGRRRMGLVFQATYLTVEADVVALVPAEAGLHVSRVAFANPTTRANLGAMLPHLAAAADLILPGCRWPHRLLADPGRHHDRA